MRDRRTTLGTIVRRRGLPFGVVLAVAAATVLLAGCTGTSSSAIAERPAKQDRQPVGAVSTLPARPAPSKPLAVGIRAITTKRDDRTLRGTIWYPARGAPGTAPKLDAKAADGEFPVVVFSHGLNGQPADYRDLLTHWASAGFVVVGPTYPHTTRGAAEFNPLDVVNQPADASQVLDAVLALDRTAGHPLRGHLDGERVAAAGHSAGGITTVGLFTTGRDDRIDAGVVLAGNALGVGTAFAGPAAPLLFVHGEDDPLVSQESSHKVFGKVPWPKAFLSLAGKNHADPYLDHADPAFAVVSTATTDFLRWSLYGDAAAKSRLRTDTTGGGLATLEDQL